MKFLNYRIVPPILIVLLLLYFTVEIFSKSGGITGRTSTSDGGCQASGCHNTSVNTATGVSLINGNLTVEPSSSNSYTIKVSNSNSSQTKAGINIAVKTSSTGGSNSGTLSPASGSGLQASGGELTHTSPKSFSDGSAEFSFEWTAPSTPGVYYLRAAANAVNGNGSTDGDQWNWMSVQELTVKGITLTEPMASGLNFCVGQEVSIKWTNVGVENVKIELSTNGGTNWNYTIQSSTPANSGTYTWTIPNDVPLGNQCKIRVSDVSSSSLNSVSTNNFSIGGPFTIETHPESKQVCSGTNHTLSVIVSGGGVSYQWMKDGNNISGATNSTLQLSNITNANAGNYTVKISSNCQSPITSNQAAISVIDAPQFTQQPASINVCQGMAATFAVVATGENLTYQWFFDNQLIEGATENNYVINSADLANAGAYYCMVNSDCGEIKSSIAELKINKQPEFTNQPTDVSICEGLTATFTVNATGLENIYEWYFNENLITAPSQPFLVLENVSENNAGNYHCIISNSCGQPQRSENVILSILKKPEIKLQPQNKSVTVGDAVEFTINAVNGTLTYQWRKNNENIPNATLANLSFDNVTKKDAGKYDCIVTNSCGDVISIAANLNVDNPIAGPSVRFASDSLNLGNVFTDNPLDTNLVNFITNNGSSLLKIDSIRVTGAGAEFVQINSSALEINPTESADILLNITPIEDVEIDVTINFYDNTDLGINKLKLKINGIKWNIETENTEIDFGKVWVGTEQTKEFVVFNKSTIDIELISAEFECDMENNFVLIEPNLPIILENGQGTDFKIKFEPTSDKSFDCMMNLSFKGTSNTLSLNLKGEGMPVSVEEDVNISQFTAFPNPSDKNLTIEFVTLLENEYTLEILSIDGKVVKSISGLANTGKNSIVWTGLDDNGYELSSGAYLVILRTNTGIKKMNIILINE